MTQRFGTYWHYTCEHGHRKLGAEGKLLSALKVFPIHTLPIESVDHRRLFETVWVTDLDAPDRGGLGLTMNYIECDRTQYRYRVTNDRGITPYRKVRGQWSKEFRDALETAPGARPDHWFVAYRPVPVVFDPSGDVMGGPI